MLTRAGRELAYIIILFAVALGLLGCAGSRPSNALPPGQDYTTLVTVDPRGDCTIIEQRGKRVVAYHMSKCDPWKVETGDADWTSSIETP